MKIWELSLATEKSPMSKMMIGAGVGGVTVIKMDNINIVRNRMTRGGEDMPLSNTKLVMD